MAAITIRGVEKQYEEPVLRDCNLDLKDQEFVVLVGPSGSGKTTLLRIIAGLEEPSAGDLYFDETRVNDVDVAQRDVAMVFQNYGLYPHMTVRGNLSFGLRKRRVRKTDIEERICDVAKLLGIESLLHRKPKQLSGGQRQRVALGRAIVRDPAVFLLDEPLSNLDAHLRAQMRSEIIRVHRSVSATTICVTHDQVDALTMGDRVVVIDDGEIQQVGTPDELYHRPVNRFVAGFIGTPPMGFVTCRTRELADRIVVESARSRIVVPREQSLPGCDGTEVVVGLRPEDLKVVPNGVREDSDSNFVLGVVEAADLLGAEQHLVVDVDGERIGVRIAGNPSIKIGEEVCLSVESRQAHFFDSVTGMACP